MFLVFVVLFRRVLVDEIRLEAGWMSIADGIHQGLIIKIFTKIKPLYSLCIHDKPVLLSFCFFSQLAQSIRILYG